MRDWQAMDRATLDDAYANAPYIPDAESYPARWRAAAETFRAAHPPEVLTYGSDAAERVDLFRPGGEAAGLVVFVHGGYWRRFGRRDWSHFAEGSLARGYAVAVVGYPLAPSVRIGEITRCVARAVDVAADAVAGPIHLVGHSAGGHLVARMLMADAAPGCADRFAACLPISPLADLRPLVPQALNDDLRLDADEAVAESPVLGKPSRPVRTVVHVGAEERPAFLWQAEALGTAWGLPVRRAGGRHHFDVIDALRDPASTMMDDLLGPAATIGRGGRG